MSFLQQGYMKNFLLLQVNGEKTEMKKAKNETANIPKGINLSRMFLKAGNGGTHNGIQ